MPTEVEDPPEQSVAALVSGTIGDLQCLVEQQLQLTGREIEAEIYRGAVDWAMFAIGIGIFFLSTIEMSLTLVHLLHWYASPTGTDPASLPLWECHAIVTTVLTVVGVTLSLIGRTKLSHIQRCQTPTVVISQEQLR